MKKKKGIFPLIPKGNLLKTQKQVQIVLFICFFLIGGMGYIIVHNFEDIFSKSDKQFIKVNEASDGSGLFIVEYSIDGKTGNITTITKFCRGCSEK